MSESVLIRVNASKEIGLGHLMRCLALAQGLQKQSIKSYFWINQQAHSICKQRADWVGEIYVVAESIDQETEIQQLNQFCASHNIAGIVIDGYTFSQQYRQALHSLTLPIICFDDNNDSGELFAHMIINGAGNAHQLGYNLSNANAKLCLGSQYRVMRDEFVSLVASAFEYRPNLLITLGGSDPLGATIPILAALQTRQFSHPITLVTGAANSQSAEISKFVAHCNLMIQHLHDCQNIGQQMNHSRLAISAAGGSQFELQVCGTPSVLLVVAENQINATNDAVQQGWCEQIDCRGFRSNIDLELSANIVANSVERLWSNSELLKAMHLNALNTADQHGAQRIAKCIKECIVNG